jgi:hypothetical protein
MKLAACSTKGARKVRPGRWREPPPATKSKFSLINATAYIHNRTKERYDHGTIFNRRYFPERKSDQDSKGLVGTTREACCQEKQKSTREEKMIHDLKTWPVYFAAIDDGSKPFEVRMNDRNFQVGDTLRLREYSLGSKVYTGREISRIVTYVLPAERFPGIAPGYCVLGLKSEARPSENKCTPQQLSHFITVAQKAGDDRFMRRRKFQ